MLQEERLENIFEYIKRKKFVTVEELARKMEVSPMTIRRDLNTLCDQGRAERCHGGAQLPQIPLSKMEFPLKQDRNRTDKQRIAQRALDFIREQDTVYLGSGTTTFELARLLCGYDMPVAVVTNDLNIAGILSDSDVDVTIVGGNIQRKTRSILGHAGEQFLKQYRFSKAFLGASSVGEQFDLFSSAYDKAYLDRLILELANQSYLLVDSGKFYRQSMCLIENISRFSAVITDKKFEQREKERIDDVNIHMISI